MKRKPLNSRKPWTKEEEEKLELEIGRFTLDELARRHKRSKSAIHNKQNQLGISHRVCSENVNLSELARLFGTSAQNIKQYWVGKLGLKVHKMKFGKRFTYEFEINEFWKWAGKHKDVPHWERFEENALGIEPAWVKEKRKEAVRNPFSHRLTKSERAEFINDVKTFRYTMEELADKYGISKKGVSSRLLKWGLKERPGTVRKCRRVWTDEMEEKLRYMIEETDMRLCDISRSFGKSNRSIQTKMMQLYGYMGIEKVRKSVS